MKVEQIEDGFKVFLQNIYFKDINWDDKEIVIKRIKEVISKIKKRYNLKIKGLYRVKVYPTTVGVIIYILLLDEDNYGDCDLDLRIVLILNKDIYLKVKDSSFIIDKNTPYLYKNNYYINLKDITNYNKYLEYGELILEDEM